MADTVKPTVQITSPSNGSNVSGYFPVTATASDNVKVTSVQFLVNGKFYASPILQPPYTVYILDANLKTGPNLIEAWAFDAANNIGQTSITVNNVSADVMAPNVRIMSPTGGTLTGIIPVSIRAADVNGIARIDLHVDGGFVATGTITPPTGIDVFYTTVINWNSATVLNGTHILQAKAYDPAGNIGLSSVTINTMNDGNPPPPPDITLPTITINTPTSVTNVELPYSFTITGTAGDNVQVQKVEVSLDGGPYQLASGINPWSAQLTVSSPGGHTIRAKATDTSGNFKEATKAIKVNQIFNINFAAVAAVGLATLFLASL